MSRRWANMDGAWVVETRPAVDYWSGLLCLDAYPMESWSLLRVLDVWIHLDHSLDLCSVFVKYKQWGTIACYFKELSYSVSYVVVHFLNREFKNRKRQLKRPLFAILRKLSFLLLVHLNIRVKYNICMDRTNLRNTIKRKEQKIHVL